MIKYGLSAPYCKLNKSQINDMLNKNFDFIQVTYLNNQINLFNEYLKPIRISNHKLVPLVFHAVLEYNKVEDSTYEIIETLNKLKCNDLIIHPTSQKMYNKDMLYCFVENIQLIVSLTKANKINLYIENNAKNIGILNSVEQMSYLCSRIPSIEIALDIAHVNSLEEVKEYIDIKYPKSLHIADRNYNIEHEHLFLGQGEIDYEYVFKNYLKDFSGKLVFEAQGDIENHLYFKTMINKYINNGANNESKYAGKD